MPVRGANPRVLIAALQNGAELVNYYDKQEMDLRLSEKLGDSEKAVDSEKLDNLDSSQFLRSDAVDTANNKIKFAGPGFATQVEVHRSDGAYYAVIPYTNTDGELGKLGFDNSSRPIVRLGSSGTDNLLWHGGNLPHEVYNITGSSISDISSSGVIRIERFGDMAILHFRNIVRSAGASSTWSFQLPGLPASLQPKYDSENVYNSVGGNILQVSVYDYSDYLGFRASSAISNYKNGSIVYRCAG